MLLPNCNLIHVGSEHNTADALTRRFNMNDFKTSVNSHEGSTFIRGSQYPKQIPMVVTSTDKFNETTVQGYSRAAVKQINHSFAELFHVGEGDAHNSTWT